MTVAGLRRESARGRLIIERIAGKDYTTLASIDLMRQSCRVETGVHGCGSVRTGATKQEKWSRTPSGLSSTAENISPQAVLRAKLLTRNES
jgi:hypothetical protein